jgi:hypothetical protein
MPRLWTLGNLCRRRPRGTLESPPRPPVLISLGYLHCALEAISESWIRYSRFGLFWVTGTSQNVPPAVSESPRGIAEKLLGCRSDSFTVRQDLSGAKVRQSLGFTGLPAGSFEPVSVSHPLNFKWKFRTATPACQYQLFGNIPSRDEKLAGEG